MCNLATVLEGEPARSGDGEGLVAVAGDVRALRSATLTWTPFTIGALLVLSQVALSLQLPFAVWPRMRMTADRKVMGPLAAGRITAAVAYLVFAMICGANFWLLVSLVS